MSKSKIDIIIPIYGDFEATKGCIESVLKYSDDKQNLILINDKSPDNQINKYLKQIKNSYPHITLIEHRTNRGFVKTVNEGMLLSNSNDVILLNSDTLVTKNWVNKLSAVANSQENIATVTPFSNSASIFSYPLPGQYNDLPNGLSLEEAGNLFEKVGSSQPLVDIPTGHGFCLYIRRDAIEKVGYFDEKNFGKGYGEENDFCQRARLSGHLNAAAFNCYIYHKEGASFGRNSQRELRKERALEKVSELHPRYIKEISDFIEEDPFREFRALLDFELLVNDKRNKLLLVGHNWGGGVEKHIEEFSQAAIDNDWIPLVLEPSGKGLLLAAPQYPNLKLLLKGGNPYNDLTKLLSAIGVRHIHYHHTIGYSGDILKIPEKLGILYDVTLHDYYMVCPRINLLKPNNEYCGANTKEKICNNCLGTANTIVEWRDNNLVTLKNARMVFSPSSSCAAIHNKYFPNIDIKVIPHPYKGFKGDLHQGVSSSGDNINVALIGAIGIHKGYDILKASSEYSKINRLPINWFVVGPTSNDDQLDNVIITGEYSSRKELRDKLKENKIDLVLFASIWPETYSYVVSESWDAGLPVLTWDIGAQAERVTEVGAGWVINSLEPKALCTKIVEIKNNPSDYIRKVNNILNFKPSTQIDWAGYYGDLTTGSSLLKKSGEDINNIITRSSRLSIGNTYIDQISSLKKENHLLNGMYFSVLDSYQSVKSSRGWVLIEYFRSIRYPRWFASLTLRYFKKALKKFLPGFLWNILRKVYNLALELKFNLSLALIKRRIQSDGQKVAVSVVIPIYNRTKELEEAINSVLNQTFQNFELLLITDGSPKETLEVVRGYKDNPKVRIFEYPDNSGTSVRGRNKAILEARGKYLAFLDSDDICMPSRLADTVALFEKTGADVVYGGYEFLLDGTRTVKDVVNGQKVLPTEFTMADLQKANYLFNSATAVRTEKVREVGGLKTNMRYCEDYELWLRLLDKGAKFVPLKKSIIKYRLHGGNLELAFKENEKEWIDLALNEYKHLPKLPKRIAYVLPTTGIGGGPAVVCEHANRLRARGHDVTIIVDPVYADRYDLSWFPDQSVPIIPLEKAVIEYDILIATGWTTAHTLKALLSKKKFYFVQSDERRFTEDKRTIGRIEKTYEMDYEFMTEAKWIKKWLKKEFGKEAYLVPNAVNEEIFFPTEPLVKKGTRLRVLLEGPIDIPFKGMAEAFEAVKDLDCEVWCVSSCGKPKPEWRCDRFFEKVPQTEMKQIYSSCDILLKLSRVEGFFGPPLEMMACGGTAVVGDVTGYDEYIVDGQNALVVKLGDKKAAKEAVQRLISDNKLLQKMKDNGLKTASGMNWEGSINLLEKLVEEDAKTS